MAILTKLPQRFEDCEIRSISFDHPNVVIKIFDPFEMDYYTITYTNVAFMIMETDHIQNVVGEIFDFQNFDEAIRQSSFKNYCILRDLSDLLRENYGNYRIGYYNPIAGGDIVLAYASLMVELGMERNQSKMATLSQS
ncbi:hypothetical protein AGR7C_Lc20134 [Agrobacterium deltaense Zutra 3/1]|uniref:Uncharacterized protein n=1 Tax=Agrobacterium deltaense Zutra 3/1 TaxID=1183427 RepID=A0A1S7RLS4_9HYPH|nr:hypothetical protein [Agrobacterium deltaense]CUX54493.1 hypothetical protein AGR7C_Lc20134 [Agrobacterium deltaense Zutra 3/1]